MVWCVSAPPGHSRLLCSCRATGCWALAPSACLPIATPRIRARSTGRIPLPAAVLCSGALQTLADSRRREAIENSTQVRKRQPAQLRRRIARRRCRRAATRQWRNKKPPPASRCWPSAWAAAAAGVQPAARSRLATPPSPSSSAAATRRAPLPPLARSARTPPPALAARYARAIGRGAARMAGGHAAGGLFTHTPRAADPRRRWRASRRSRCSNWRRRSRRRAPAWPMCLSTQPAATCCRLCSSRARRRAPRPPARRPCARVLDGGFRPSRARSSSAAREACPV